jgi:outer membrane protein OmpA-like peptidoglycan-associated protein
MSQNTLKIWSRALALIIVLMMVGSAVAQDRQPSKVDIFAGYAYYDPGGRLGTTELRAVEKGYALSTTYFFDRNWGITLDSGGHFGDQANYGTIMIGPTVRFPMERVSPFLRGLVGLHRMNPAGLDGDNGIGLMAGGGLDMHLHNRISWRMVQADFVYGRHGFPGPQRFDNKGVRAATGLVFHFGTIGPPPPPPSAACSVQPQEVFAGEPVTATITTSNFNPKKTQTYAWSGTGVNVTGTGTTTQIDTNGLQPGQYSVKATATESAKRMADCTASFTVKQPRAPEVSCSASPSTVQPGQNSTITANGRSADNRNLTYSYQASAGRISGSGTTATLNTTGAQPGTINVTCNVADDRNMTGSGTTSVTVEAPPQAPPPPPAPESSRLNEIAFKNNNARVDNAAKAILDDVALRLQRDADAKVTIIGGTTGRENKRLGAQRAINAKAYLVKEKGIDASRVELRSGGEGTNAVIWWVPAGAPAPTEGEAVTEPAARRR